jgi:hypothetical protein
MSKKSPDKSRLSYKFQRLRERLRAAIESGELTGKLPGERLLAKKFHVNAKTLSKALTDLAAEGLLERSIGRGTSVRTGASSPIVARPGDKWVVVSDPDQVNSGIISHLRKHHDNIQVVTDPAELRPSLLASVRAVIDMSVGLSEQILRYLLVRNMMVVVVGREPSVYSVNAVLVDRALGGSFLAKEMIQMGHRRFLAVERRGHTEVVESIRKSAFRFAPDVVVDSVFPHDVAGAVENSGATAVICDTRRAAVVVREALARRDIAVPERVSLAAIGSGWGDYPCNGYYLHSDQKAETIAQLIMDSSAKRPTILWLTGAYVDHGTVAPLGVLPHQAVSNRAAQTELSGIPLRMPSQR